MYLCIYMVIDTWMAWTGATRLDFICVIHTFVCVYVCICMYIHSRERQGLILGALCIHICVCMCICMYVHTWSSTLEWFEFERQGLTSGALCKHVYVCMCICMFVHTTWMVCIGAARLGSRWVIINIYVCMCVCVNICTYIHNHRCLNGLNCNDKAWQQVRYHTYLYLFIYIYICTYKHAWSSTPQWNVMKWYIHTYIHTHICYHADLTAGGIYIYIYIYIYICKCICM
jgi:hypothetical protein